MDAVIAQYQKRYLPVDDAEPTQEESDWIILSIASNSDIIKELIGKYIFPIYKSAFQANNMAKKCRGRTTTAMKAVMLNAIAMVV